MCGLAINIASFAHLLKRVDFDAIMDHLAITYIMKSKMEPATNRKKGYWKFWALIPSIYIYKGQRHDTK